MPFHFAGEEAEAWVEAAGSTRTVAEHNLQQLDLIGSLVYLPNNPGTPQSGSPYDLHDVLRLGRSSTQMLAAVQANYETMAQRLAGRMPQIRQDTLTRWRLPILPCTWNRPWGANAKIAKLKLAMPKLPSVVT